MKLPSKRVRLVRCRPGFGAVGPQSWQAGDRFYPRGMKGKSKKLQDFFTDRKITRQERSKIPLLVAPEGLLWVVGRRG